MREVWRITTQRFASTAFSGEGARLYGGRWNPKGFAMIYTAESRALALLEMLVQDDPLQARYMLIPVVIPASIRIETYEAHDLPNDWQSLSSRDALQSLGRTWLQGGTSAVLTVPIAVLPAERNYLINPLHPDFSEIKPGQAAPLDVDLRLLRKLAG